MAATEPSGEIKDMKPKGHKPRKSSKAYRSQSHDRAEKKAREPGELTGHISLQIYIFSFVSIKYLLSLKFLTGFLLEHRAEAPVMSQLSALNLPVTSQSPSRSDTRTEVCVSGVYAPEDGVSRPERHSPAGSSRPGSARHTHPTHSRPRTSGRTAGSASSIIPSDCKADQF